MHSVIFDLDGTLADTSVDLISAANACFIGMGVGPQLDPMADASTAFKGGRAMLTLGMQRLGRADDLDEIERQYPLLLAHYGENIDANTVFYEGALEAVYRLRARGVSVGICTNKPEGLAETLMSRMGARDLFDALIGADTLPVRKPDPAPLAETIRLVGGVPERSVLIGDTITDRKCAENLGIPCVLVTFGPDGDGVRDLAPEGLLDHYSRLEVVLAEVMEGFAAEAGA